MNLLDVQLAAGDNMLAVVKIGTGDMVTYLHENDLRILGRVEDLEPLRGIFEHEGNQTGAAIRGVVQHPQTGDLARHSDRHRHPASTWSDALVLRLGAPHTVILQCLGKSLALASHRNVVQAHQGDALELPLELHWDDVDELTVDVVGDELARLVSLEIAPHRSGSIVSAGLGHSIGLVKRGLHGAGVDEQESCHRRIPLIRTGEPSEPLSAVLFVVCQVPTRGLFLRLVVMQDNIPPRLLVELSPVFDVVVDELERNGAIDPGRHLLADGVLLEFPCLKVEHHDGLGTKSGVADSALRNGDRVVRTPAVIRLEGPVVQDLVHVAVVAQMALADEFAAGAVEVLDVKIFSLAVFLNSLASSVGIFG
ncbi:MAG: hypothetical protein UV82_C0001G0002 [Candidatus Magasanikbacteria bacterium GW2011_GWD2_43_18]|nr:MAG: hypothetical protein UV18_C0001G0079 [Candidatus Magasanikbacteria bacterium GW2011_GWC2_42_27]KKT05213.1 MAG: hypothetical protein UV82_C0001G0002 [Candidatus Magasanikbacteria bacterium GW2011_GWD2_43_18]